MLMPKSRTRERRLVRAFRNAIQAWDALDAARAAFIEAWQAAKPEERRAVIRNVLDNDGATTPDGCPREIFSDLGA